MKEQEQVPLECKLETQETMSPRELRGRLADLHRRLEDIEDAAFNRHFVIMVAFVVLLLRGCSAN